MARMMLVLVAALLPVAGGAAVLLPRDGDGLNQPHSATISSESLKLVMPSDASRIDYTYDGTGLKHQTVHTTVTKTKFGNKVLTRTKRDTTRYVGSRIYENGRLDRVLTPYGYMQGGHHHTFLHDYQGNVAAVVVGDSVAQRNSYYPYGLPHVTGLIKLQSPSATSVTDTPYKYGGKEYDTFGGTDLYDFHARYHAPSTGRFMTVDPMAEKYPGISPYMYCAGNPIAYIDPDGMQIFVNIDDMIYYYREIEKGEYWLVDEDGNEYQGADQFALAVINALDMLRSGDIGSSLVNDLVSSTKCFNIIPSEYGWFKGSEDVVNEVSCFTIGWDPHSTIGGPSESDDGTVSNYRPSFVGLGHELAHGWDRIYGLWDKTPWYNYDLEVKDKRDIFAIHVENMIRAEHNLPLRYAYDKDALRSRCLIGGSVSVYYAPYRYVKTKF